MAKHPNVEVSVFLPQCSEEDKRDADKYAVKLIEAVRLDGFEPVDWLASRHFSRSTKSANRNRIMSNGRSSCNNWPQANQGI